MQGDCTQGKAAHKAAGIPVKIAAVWASTNNPDPEQNYFPQFFNSFGCDWKRSPPTFLQGTFDTVYFVPHQTIVPFRFMPKSSLAVENRLHLQQVRELDSASKPIIRIVALRDQRRMDPNTDFDPADVEAELEQNPVSRRRLARDIAEMVKEPYPNVRFIPGQDSIVEACLHLVTKTRTIHVDLKFPANYIEIGPLITINGRADLDELHEAEVRCTDVLAGMGPRKQAYTLKTLAIHLLSMWDEEGQEPTKFWFWDESWILSKWEDFSCNKCGYPSIDIGAINPDADDRSISQPAVLKGPNQSKTIFDLPPELLKNILEHLEVQDLVRFGQAFDEIEDFIEEHAVIRDRELECFVTKEHFTQSPLGIGVHSPGWRPAPSTVESEFDLISLAAFRDLGVRATAYGCGFEYWLPLALSEGHWEQIKDEAYERLRVISRPSVEVDHMGVLIGFMEDQAMKLFTFKKDSSDTGLLQDSDKGIESLCFIFHLMVCVAVDKPEYVDKANKMIEDFQTRDACTNDMPSPGRILAALLVSDVTTNIEFLPKLFIETITRNVPELLERHLDLGFLEDDGVASSYRLYHTFNASLVSYRTLMLMDVFQRTVRPATNGSSLIKTRDALFLRRGFPPSAALADLATERRRIMDVDSFPSLCNYLGIYRDTDERGLAGLLRQAVLDATGDRGLVFETLSRDESLVLRHAAEGPCGLYLLYTEDLPPCPDQPTLLEVESKLGTRSPLYRAKVDAIWETIRQCW